MAANMITLPKDASHWQQQLSTLDEPVPLSKDPFELVWPLVISVYTFATGYSKQAQLKLGIEQSLKEKQKVYQHHTRKGSMSGHRETDVSNYQLEPHCYP